MKQFIAVVFLASMLGSLSLSAQRFKGYVAMGLNISEAYLTQSGNAQVGTRLGLNLGPGVAAVLHNRWEANLELLYSQNGHYTKLEQVPNTMVNKLSLHYIEVPLALSYRFNIKKDEQASFYKRNISAGIAYARLFAHKALAFNGTELTEEVRFEDGNHLLFHIAATSFFTQSFAVNARGTLSMLGEWTVALRVLYYI